jgi:hypothetical protein
MHEDLNYNQMYNLFLTMMTNFELFLFLSLRTF